jgi:hypothetical protein
MWVWVVLVCRVWPTHGKGRPGYSTPHLARWYTMVGWWMAPSDHTVHHLTTLVHHLTTLVHHLTTLVHHLTTLCTI